MGCAGPAEIRKPGKTHVMATEKSVLNYEDSAENQWAENLLDHFLIHIEIEKPYVLKHAAVAVDDIYRLCGIEGTAVYSALVDPTGAVKELELIKSAGLGIDDITGRIVKNIRLEPSYLAGKSYATRVHIRVTVKGNTEP